jgi:RNase H-like domain found in reverse transcriptase
LLGKPFDFHWNASHQQAFASLKKVFQAPVLAHLDFTHPFIVDPDASNHYFGAVLSQVDEHLVAFSHVNYLQPNKTILQLNMSVWQ